MVHLIKNMVRLTIPLDVFEMHTSIRNTSLDSCLQILAAMPACLLILFLDPLSDSYFSEPGPNPKPA